MAEQRSTLIIEISSEQAARNARALDRELQSIERTGNYATTSMNSMSVAARQLAGYLAGVVTVGTAIAKMDDWTNLNNRLRLVTTSQKALNVAMQDTFDIAQRSGAAWGGTATIYQKIQYNSEKLGLSQEKVAKITESISKSISNSGSSAQAASAALYQLGQSFDKSSLNGDEFVSMSENAGYLMEVFAKGLGVTRAELKEMSSQGLLTTDKMVQAIEKMSGSIEDDFGKTNFTIGQSFTQLSNAVTKFVGEAGQGSGAASTLSSSIKLLADNFGSIANIAMLGGVALLTKTIINQTLSVKASIAASIQRRAALTAELESQVRLTGLEVQRTRQVAALALTEVNLARQEYNNATTRTARAAATIRLTQAEIAHNLALNQSTVAIGANTSAQNALNASRALGARALALVGGPIGAITIGVTALAAGYMYMSGKAAEANKKLEEQAEVAKKAKEELLALKGLEKDDAIDKMTAAFQRQNEALTESSSKVNMQLNAIEQLYKGNKDVVKVVQDARNGTISMNEAVQRFNELRISKEVYNSIKANTVEFAKNATEANNSKYKMSLFGIEVELAGRKAQTAKFGVDQNTNSLSSNATAADKATKAQKDYFDSLTKDVLSANERLAFMNLGFSKEVIDQINKLQEAKQKALGDSVTAIVTTEEINRIVQAQKALDAVKDRESEITRSKQEQTKELERQQKLQEKQAVALAGNNEQTRNMLRVYQAFRNTGLGDKQARVMTAQVGRENDFNNASMFGSHGDFNNGFTNTGFFSWQKGRSANLMKFLQGQGVLDKNGKIQQTQDALDAMAKYAMQEVTTVKSYSKTKNALTDDNLSYRDLEKIIGKNFVGWDYNGNGKLGKVNAGKHLAKQDGYYNKLSNLLGSDPENSLSSIKMWAKFEDEAFKARAKTEDEIKQLQAKYDTEAIQRSKARDEEITQATILGQTQLLPKIKERYDAQDKLAKLQQDYELNGYKYTEDQKLIYQRDSAKEQLDAEGKYSDEVKTLYKKSIDDLYDYEIKKTKLVRESALFEHKRVLMLEADAIKQKYQLERREIELNAKAKGYDAEYLKAYNASYIRGGVGIDDNHTSRTKNQFLPNTPYTDKDSDLEKLKAYSGLLLQSQGIMQTAVNMAKNGRGEDSKTFKMLGGGLEAITGIQQLTSARSGQKTELSKLNEERDNTLKQLQERLDAVKNAEDTSHQERLDAEKVFQSAKEQLQKEYSVKSVEAVKADNQNQLAFYGQMLSQTSVVWSDMTQLIKDAKGENSKTFRAMFLAQQSMAIAQQIINTELAAGATTAQTGIFGMPAAAVIRGVGYASVGLIAAQTIAGFSNGGYTGAGGKYDPAGIVHKGEVVFSQEDIARWGGVGNVEKLRKNGGYSDGGVVGNSYNQGRQYDAISQARANVALQPNITINNYSNETVETSTAPNGDLLVQIGKMMDKKIDDGVDKGIQRNLKQGYPLARAIKNKG